MSIKIWRRWVIVLSALAIVLTWTSDAMAYIGPGAGLEMIWGFTIPLLGFIATAFSAVFLYPIYSLIRRIRGIKDAPSPVAATEMPAAEPAPATQPVEPAE